MKIFYNIKEVQEELNKYSNHKIGFVPTMGTLHQGHLSLINQAKIECDLVLVSIFVNIKQFNDANDYSLYPKDLSGDIEKIEDIVDILFCPPNQEIYPQGFSVSVSVANITTHLCGKSRVDHFNGVTLIIVKLFNIIKPKKAFFGEKDFQQLQVIKRLVKDLNIDVEVVGCKTLRQNDGLAISSRNFRLSKNGQKIATNIYFNLCLAKVEIAKLLPINLVLEKIRKNLSEIGLNNIDYLQVCDENNLLPVEVFNPKIKSRLFIAIYIENIRLIDNLEL